MAPEVLNEPLELLDLLVDFVPLVALPPGLRVEVRFWEGQSGKWEIIAQENLDWRGKF